MNIQPFFILILALSVFSKCNVNSGREAKNISPDNIREPMIQANKSYVEEESARIRAFVKRQKWEVKETGTGLRYMIYHRASDIGETAKEGQFAKVNFKISLLDGTLCYNSDDTGPEKFLIGQDNVESGLHEGITYMRVGDKAKLILPAHLAHGLIGDQHKIPARTPIVYDIELLELN